jgi:hypothetical protein
VPVRDHESGCEVEARPFEGHMGVEGAALWSRVQRRVGIERAVACGDDEREGDGRGNEAITGERGERQRQALTWGSCRRRPIPP